MQYYFAPMEGLTDHIFREIHHRYFPGIHRYYTPFLSPTVHRKLTPKEAREIPPANSVPYKLIPQLLTKNTEDFIWMANQCADLGYDEINLNLGCPSGTVTAKGKGSGMLRDTDALDAFLYTVCKTSPLPVSVKTRIGFESPGEFPALLEIYNRYPIRELTVHPRVRSAFYNGSVDHSAFADAVKTAKMPLCFNGNICSLRQANAIGDRYPGVEAVMIGRGLIGDPGMVTPGGTTTAGIFTFTTELMEAYTEAFGSARNAMFRMKENWRYLHRRFDGSEKLYKKLRKTTDLTQYQELAQQITETLPLAAGLRCDW